MFHLGRALHMMRGGVSKHLPALLTGAGIIFSGLGMVCSAKGSLEASRRLAEYEEAQGTTDISVKETLKVAAPCYVPAAICYAGSIACLIGAHQISATRLIAAISSAMAAEKTLRDNREAVAEVFNKKGLTKVDQFLNETRGRQAYNDHSYIYETGHGHTLCCESYATGVMFRASPEWIHKCVNDYNAMVNEGLDPSYMVFLETLLPNLPVHAIPEYTKWLHMPMDPCSSRQELMSIQVDSDLTDDGEPYLIFTQRVIPETRQPHTFEPYID